MYKIAFAIQLHIPFLSAMAWKQLASIWKANQGCPIVRNSSFRIPQGPQNPPFSRDFDQKECQFTSSQHRYFKLVGVFINKS